MLAALHWWVLERYLALWPCVACLQEKWVYDNKTFNGFAKHYKTGKPVPSDMFAKIQGSQTYRKGE